MLDAKLRSIRILDPACGSGAFLIKAAETILGIHKLIWEARGISDSMDVWIDETRIREIILRNIYGVDKSTDSVGITKLALFLKTAQKGEKLPSLDGNIKVGNSLIRNKEAVSNAFDWEYEFSDILSPIDPDGFGFDVIMGNPPYIRQEDLKEIEAAHAAAGTQQPWTGRIQDTIKVRSIVLFFLPFFELVERRWPLGIHN